MSLLDLASSEWVAPRSDAALPGNYKNINELRQAKISQAFPQKDKNTFSGKLIQIFRRYEVPS